MIDFFSDNNSIERISIKQKYATLDWLDLYTVEKAFKETQSVLLLLPEELTNNLQYFHRLSNYLPIDKIYPFFLDNVKNDNSVIQRMFEKVLQTGQNCHLLPYYILNEIDYMAPLLTKFFGCYRNLGQSLKKDINFNIKLLNHHLNNFEFNIMLPETFNHPTFLIATLDCVEKNQLNLSKFLSLLPQDVRITFDSIEPEDKVMTLQNKIMTLKSILFKKHLESELSSDIINKSITRSKHKI